MSTPLRHHWPWLVGGAIALVLLGLLAPIMTPFAVGAGLAYVGDPIVDALQRRGLSRTAGVCVVFVVLGLVGLALLVIVVPMLYEQFLVMLQRIPELLVWIQDRALPKLGFPLPDGVKLDPQTLKDVITQHWTEAGGFAKTLWTRVAQSSGAVIAAGATLLMVPVVSFYLLRDWDELVAWIASMIPPRMLPKVSALARETDSVLGHFIRGQLSVMAALAFLYSAGLALVGLDLALVIGIGAGMVSFVPYLGFVLGFASATLAMVVQTQEFVPLLWVALVFGVGQVLESAVLTPNLVGDKIGLHPVAVIFAVLAGGQLFGFVGVLLALPAAAVVAVLLRHAKEHWLLSPLYRDGAPLPPPPADLPLPGTAPPDSPP
ncbi:MAG TPA: AI-2E family transporter [Solimonas sp.]|nr:AI-2E family transporter [Solimonas sp.]